jgi:hypothetical protein
MPEVLAPNLEAKISSSEQQNATNRISSLARSLVFKYYIHDSVPTLRFQLIGDLRAANVRELNGSWETARTTLNNRRFLLDVNQLYSVDDDGRAWLIKMKESGAEFLPAKYMDSPQTTSAPQVPEQVCAVKLSLLGRVLGLLNKNSKS